MCRMHNIYVPVTLYLLEAKCILFLLIVSCYLTHTVTDIDSWSSRQVLGCGTLTVLNYTTHTFLYDTYIPIGDKLTIVCI